MLSGGHAQAPSAIDLDEHEDTVFRAYDSQPSTEDEGEGNDTGDSSEDDYYMQEALRQGKTLAKGAPWSVSLNTGTC